MAITRTILLAAALFCPSLVFAEPATEAKMAAEALLPYVRTKDPQERSDRLREHKQRLDNNSRFRPDEIRSATLVFNRGLDTAELSAFAARHNLTVIGFHTKAPMGEDGHVLSVGVGMDDLMAIDGDLTDRLSYALDLARSRIHDLAMAYSQSSLEEDRKKAKEYEQVVAARQVLFSVEAFGSSRSLSEASNQTHVAGIFLDRGDEKIKEFQARSLYR